MELKAFCKNSPWCWSGSLVNFLEHFDTWEDNLKDIPDSVRNLDELEDKFENVNFKEEWTLDSKLIEKLQEVRYLK